MASILCARTRKNLRELKSPYVCIEFKGRKERGLRNFKNKLNI